MAPTAPVSKELLETYARLMLRVGINLQTGQNLVIRGEPVHWNFCLILAAEAYRMGARFVRVEAIHEGLYKARLDNSREEFDHYVPSDVEGTLQSYLDDGWALISLRGRENPDIFNDCDKAKMARIDRAAGQKTFFFSRAVGANKIPWLVAAYPTPGWAVKVFPDKDPLSAEKALWQDLISILRLDQPDPLTEWRHLSLLLHERRSVLNRLRLDYLHFEVPGTDLKVGLSPYSIWMGGSALTQDDTEFMPNLPTEEIFTSPDFRCTEGTVACTRPVTVMGVQVMDARFRFEEGRVVEFDAREGKDSLAEFLAMDSQAPFLGEVSLVDTSSPIYQLSRIYQTILLDENAACHIALGRGFPDAWTNGTTKNSDTLMNEGCNISIVHTDFMIGSERVSVTGVQEDGTRVPLITDGKFVI